MDFYNESSVWSLRLLETLVKKMVAVYLLMIRTNTSQCGSVLNPQFG
jgi:hypothetical protein